MKLKTQKSHGQALATVIIVVMFFLALIWTVTTMLENESKWTEKEKRRTVAFHCADTAQARAYWKISETSSGWDSLLTSTYVPYGFNGETVFTNEDGSMYKVHISTAKINDTDSIIIRTVGTDKNFREVRGIKTIYQKVASQEAAINVKGGAEFKGAAAIHWGCIVSKEGNIQVQGSDPYWPRKFAGSGYLVLGRDSSISLPNIGPSTSKDGRSVEEEYQEWSSNNYREADTVDINLSEYVIKAKSYRTPSTAPSRSLANPAGSGYYEGVSLTFPNKYEDRCSTAVYYVKNGNVSFSAQAYIGPPKNASGAISDVAFIVETGNLDMPNCCTSGAPGNSSYTVKVPTSAWKEYQIETKNFSNRGDTTASNEYPGDLGYRSSGGTYNLSNVWFHGLMYVGGNLRQGSGNKNVVGVVIVKGAVDKQSGTVDYWYDKLVDTKILYSGGKFSKTYWAEFVPGNFNNPDWSK